MKRLLFQELPAIDTGRSSPKPRKPPLASTTHFPLVSRCRGGNMAWYMVAMVSGGRFEEDFFVDVTCLQLQNLKCFKNGSPEISKFQTAKRRDMSILLPYLSMSVFFKTSERLSLHFISSHVLSAHNRGVRLTMNVQNLIPHLAVDPIHLPPVDRLDRWIWAFMAGVPHSATPCATPNNANIHKCSQFSTFCLPVLSFNVWGSCIESRFPVWCCGTSRQKVKVDPGRFMSFAGKQIQCFVWPM